MNEKNEQAKGYRLVKDDLIPDWMYTELAGFDPLEFSTEHVNIQVNAELERIMQNVRDRNV